MGQSGVEACRKRPRARALAAALLALGLLAAAPASAGYNEGLAAQQRGDLPGAIREFTPLANSGNTLAQVRLAEIYFNGGTGVERDIARGMEWLRKAAKAGNVDAMFFLGQTLIDGNLGQARDIPEAVRLLEIIATKANDTRAMALLAQIYLKGDGVPQNEQRAVALFRSLGERGNGPAWRVLAGLSHEGKGGLSADPAVMAGFLARGVALGDAASHFFLGELYLRGEGVPQNEKEGFRLIRLAADGGDFNAMLALANIYIQGSAGQSADRETAFKWLSVVANRAPQGDAYFQASLAVQQMRQQLSDAAIARAQEEAGKFQARQLPAQNPPVAKP